MADDLRTGTHNGHVMVAALKRHRDKPVMHLGDATITGGPRAQTVVPTASATEASFTSNQFLMRGQFDF